MNPLTKISKQVIFIVGAVAITGIGLLLFILYPIDMMSTDEPQVTKVYFADHISPAHQMMIDRFNALHKGRIEVVPVNLPFEKFSTNERKELLARSLRSKSDRLDIFSVDYIWVSRFAKWSEPMDGYFTMEERKKLLPSALASCICDSSLVAIPMYIDIGLMYYRKDIIERLPDHAEIEKKLKASISWDELLKLRPRLHLTGNPFYIFQADDYEGLVCSFFEILEGKDPNFFRNGELRLTTPEARDALQFMVDCIYRTGITPASVTDFKENDSYIYALRNDGVFLRGWPNFLRDYRERNIEREKMYLLDRAALPHFSGSQPRSVFGGWNLMIAKTSTKKAEALEFIRFLLAEESQKKLYEAGGYLPVSKKVYEDSTYTLQQSDLLYYKFLLDRGFHRPALVEYTKVSDIISNHIHRALKRQIGVEEALRQASEMIRTNAILIR